LITRDTVVTLTRARAATSRMVGLGRPPLFLPGFVNVCTPSSVEFLAAGPPGI